MVEGPTTISVVLSEQDRPMRETEADSLIVPLKPPAVAIVIVDVPDCPEIGSICVGSAVIEKPGGTG